MNKISYFFKHYYSPRIFFPSIIIVLLMLTAAKWQWRRFCEKTELVESYKNHKLSAPLQFNSNDYDSIDLTKYQTKKVLVRGAFDFSKPIIVTNRRHKLGFGHWLMVPYVLENSKKSILVSKGFIPYEEREKSSWSKYFKQEDQVIGVVNNSVGKRSPFSPSAKMPFSDTFLYPDLELIKDSIHAEIETNAYIQEIADPISGDYPATDISIDVPPSTHFWYTFEWIGLAILTMTISTLVQIFKPRGKKFGVIALTILGIFLCSSKESFALSDPSTIEQRAGITEHLGAFIDPLLIFTDETGVEVSFEEVYKRKKPIVLAPVYFECPRLCNFTQAGLLKTINKVRPKLTSDYTVLSISFNSKEKSELAKNRAEKYREQLENTSLEDRQGWKFFVGESEMINKLLDTIGFRYEFDQGEFMHAAGLIFLSPEGKIVRYLYGIEFPQRDFELALAEASEGKTGSFMNKAMIFCFRYDHTKGQYTVAIWRIIRFISFSFLIILISYLLYLRFSEITDSRKL